MEINDKGFNGRYISGFHYAGKSLLHFFFFSCFFTGELKELRTLSGATEYRQETVY